MSFNVAQYFMANDIHQFCREWMEQMDESQLLDEDEAYQIIDRNLDLRIESKMADCLKTRVAKNSMMAVIYSGQSLQLSEVHRAVALCEYANQRDEPSKELILCLMNRVEFLLKYDAKGIDYLALLADLEFVLANNSKTNGETQHRQLYIKSFCLAKIGRCEESLHCINEAEAVFGMKENITSIEKVMFNNNKNKVLSAIRNFKAEDPDIDTGFAFPLRVQESNKENPVFSEAVNIVTEIDGRKKIVANRRITTGEVIGVEVAQCSSLNYIDGTASLSHCNHCLQFTKTPLPCPNCCDVMFCSFDCLRAALDTYHAYECKMALASLIREWNDDPALRVLLPVMRQVYQTPLQHFASKDCQRDDEELAQLLNKLRKKVYLYRYFQTLTVACLRMIRTSGYLQGVVKHSDNEKALCRFLFKRIVAIWLQADCIVEPTLKCLPLAADIELSQIGFGLFSSLRLIRHGCIQNVFKIFKGNRQAIVASRNIEEGDEILINRLWNLNRRQCPRLAFLSNHFLFERCNCLACTENLTYEVDLMESLPDHETLHKYVEMDLDELEVKGDPLTLLDFIKEKSDFLEQQLDDKTLYYLHGATNPEVLRCLLFTYGLIKIDPTGC